MLLVITSTRDELSIGIKVNDVDDFNSLNGSF